MAFVFLQFFVAPPYCCPQPRWYSVKFAEVFQIFASACKGVPSNVHVLDLYVTDPSMYELNGQHLKSYCGKDMLDHYINCADSGMVRVSLDGDERAAEADNRLALVEGRVDLVRQDLARNSHRLDVVAARAAEDSEAAQNEK